MSDKPILQAGPNHPITIEPTGHRVTVTRAGRTVAVSEDAVTLREADYAPVHYIPLKDVDAALLTPTAHTSYCPFKGDAHYHSLVLDGDTSENAVWQYREPHPGMEPITGHVAFYPDRVSIREG